MILRPVAKIALVAIAPGLTLQASDRADSQPVPPTQNACNLLPLTSDSVGTARIIPFCTGSAIAPPEAVNTAAKIATVKSTDRLTDIAGHWGQKYIEALAERGIIRGFPDGSFRPDAPMTRAELAAMLQDAFPKNSQRSLIEFVDVPAHHWARNAIQDAFRMGFLDGYPNRRFEPERRISRIELLVAVVNGFNLTATAASATEQTIYFEDAASIPQYARSSVRTAIAHRLILNDHRVQYFYPNRAATRAEVAALIYQAWVRSRSETLAVVDPSVSPQLESPMQIEPSFTNPPPVPVPVNLLESLFATADSPGVVAIGTAEGTRTPDGGKTAAYWGHRDSGNGVWNQGTFSYQHGGSTPEEADGYQLRRLRGQVAQMLQQTEALGMTLSPLELLAGADLATQAPLAAPDYVPNLQRAIARGLTGVDAVLEARVQSFVNPRTGQLEAAGFGNSWERLRRDQARRLAALYNTLEKQGLLNRN